MTRGPWQRLKTREYHLANEWERVQWACGIPARFWNMKTGVVPAAFHYKTKNGIERTTKQDQQIYLDERISHPELLTENRLVCITSHPSDEHGLAAACMLARVLIQQQWEAAETIKVRVDDIQDYEQCVKLKLPFYTIDPNTLFIHNLDENTSRSRLSLVRDLLVRHEGAYRGVIAACENPKKFCRDILHIEPQEYYHFEGKPKKTMVRG